MSDLTAIILTKNEEANIQKCINSLRAVAKRIVVVDSYSTDGTVELAKALGADVFQHTFENHSAQFNWAIENVDLDTTWMIKIDADEELTPELAAEIDEKLGKLPDSVNGVILRRRMYFMGKWIRHGGMYPGLRMRILRVGFGLSEPKSMDEHLIITSGETVMFDNDFSDKNNKPLECWVNKHNWYSNKEVFDQQMIASGSGEDLSGLSKQAKVRRFIRNHGYYKLPKFIRAHMYFIYRYWIRLGFLDGTEGRIYAFLQAYWYRYLVDAKIYECEKAGKRMMEQGELN